MGAHKSEILGPGQTVNFLDNGFGCDVVCGVGYMFCVECVVVCDVYCVVCSVLLS